MSMKSLKMVKNVDQGVSQPNMASSNDLFCSYSVYGDRGVNTPENITFRKLEFKIVDCLFSFFKKILKLINQLSKYLLL